MVRTRLLDWQRARSRDCSGRDLDNVKRALRCEVLKEEATRKKIAEAAGLFEYRRPKQTSARLQRT